jgi:hypothetical protein
LEQVVQVVLTVHSRRRLRHKAANQYFQQLLQPVAAKALTLLLT